jgi:hypothetical protein
MGKKGFSFCDQTPPNEKERKKKELSKKERKIKDF